MQAQYKVKVSVLISFYNLAPYVDETMRSVLSQETSFPFEVICADDGSGDATVEILQQWQKNYPEQIKLFEMPRDKNRVYEALERIERMNAIRKKLLQTARGQYFCFLDGDDFYTDTAKLQKQADVLDADTAKQYIACGHNGNFYWGADGKTEPIARPLRACGLTAQEYWSFLYIHTNALLFRNILLDGIDPQNAGLPFNDNLITFQMLQYGGIYYLPDCMFNYRQVEGSSYHRRTACQNNILNAVMLCMQRKVTRKFDKSGLVRTMPEFAELYAARRDPQLAKEAEPYGQDICRYHADRLRRIVNYTQGSRWERVLCDLENPVCFFKAKVYRKLIWQKKVRALLEESRHWQRETNTEG